MSAMIWDSASQAFKESAEVPKRFDAESGAWTETTGMAYDDAAGAWTERWSSNKRLYLYNEGDECTDVTGGWAATVSGRTGGTVTKNGDSIKITSYSGSNEMMVITQKSVDLSGYTKIGYVLSDVVTSQLYPGVAGYINFSSNRTKYTCESEFHISSDKSVSVGTEIYNDLISSLVGKCLYIGMDACYNSGSITVKKLWLE